jgi:hypothetical protein
MKELYYKGKNGLWYTEHDLRQAYLITTGRNSWEHECSYYSWVKLIWGLFIIEEKADDEMSIDELLANNQRLMAMKVYKAKNNCTLVEAREAINRMKGK